MQQTHRSTPLPVKTSPSPLEATRGQPPSQFSYRPPPDEGLETVHCDDAVLVVLKPAGLLSVVGRGPGLEDCQAARVQLRYPEARIVHRLDMATSGLMVFARGKEAERALSIAFQKRQVEKGYVAVVAGSVQRDEGRIDLPLITDWPNRPRQKVDQDIGKPSLTHYRVLAREKGLSTRLALTPVTGRSHQLRVHLAAIGHPILGDELYAPPAAQGPRLLLHATHLCLPHPLSGERLAFSHPAPF